MGVVGAGTMGSQIAAQSALHGLDVVLVDEDAARLREAVANNRRLLARRVAKGTLTEPEVETSLGRVETSRDPASLAPCELVVEAVFEDLGVKREVFAELAEVCSPVAILVTNSSTFPIASLFDDLPYPERSANLHFFHPVLVMKLVEVMRGPETSDATVGALLRFAERIGRESVVIERAVSGLVVNRILAAIKREALWLAAEGYALPADIDRAIKLGLNHPMGPFELTDFSGLDVFLGIMRQRYAESGDEGWKPPRLLEEKVEAGHLGRKAGRGFYEY